MQLVISFFLCSHLSLGAIDPKDNLDNILNVVEKSSKFVTSVYPNPYTPQVSTVLEIWNALKKLFKDSNFHIKMVEWNEKEMEIKKSGITANIKILKKND